MVQDYIDSARAGAEADRIASEARQNLKQVFVSLRNSLELVCKTRLMLEVDPKCICVVNSYSNDEGESKWEERNELHEAANTMEIAIEVLGNSLLCIEASIEASFGRSDALCVRPYQAIVEDDNTLWCERVCVHEKVDMDNALWCTTSPTILEMVFARLHLHQIFQLRGLSKHWRAAIISPSFQHAFSAANKSSRVAILAGTSRQGLWSVGTTERKWYMLLFDFLPSHCNNPVAADGGLLCCRHRGPSNRTQDLYVCNPLTQAWRKLSRPLQVHGFDLVHFVTDRQTKQYTITVVSDDLRENEHNHNRNAKAVVEVYDSARKTWSASGDGAFQSSAAGNNLFYYKKYVKGKFVGIRAYDTTTGYSRSISFDFLDDIVSFEMLGFFPLVEHQGQMYMLRTTETMEMSGVWVLRPPSHVWEKLYSVPEPEDLKFYHFSLLVSTDAIIIFGNKRVFYDDDMEDEFYEDSEGPDDPYFWMLNRSQGTWLDVANDRLDSRSCSQIMFEMRLDAVP